MPSANTPTSGQSISVSEIFNVFGSGNDPLGKTRDVNDYKGYTFVIDRKSVV